MRFKPVLYFIIVLSLLVLVACQGEEVGTENTNINVNENEDTNINENTNENEEVNNNAEENGHAADEMPIVEDPITISMFAAQQSIPADWNDLFIWNEYEEMTNVNVEWEQVPGESLEEKRNLALASGNLPDAFYISSVPSLDLYKYGQQGTFIELNELIEENAPNLQKLMDEHPEIRKGMTFPDGNIYSLPSLVSPDYLSFAIGSRPYFHKEWLEELDMDMPETTDEFYDYLVAVKELDPVGNGETVPYGGTSINDLVGWLRGSFGLANKGVQNSNIDLDPDKDEVRFYATTEEYKEMLEYVSKLYSEELIEQNIFTIEWGQYLANASEGFYGSTVFYDPIELFGEEQGVNYDSGLALEGPNGDRSFTKVAPLVASIGNFTITSENEHPAETIRWMDYFYGEEGTKFFYMGVEGETYEETPEGEIVYVDKIKNSEDGNTLEQEAAKYFAWIGGFVGIVKQDYYSGSESTEGSVAAANELEPHIPDELWPGFTYTEEENKFLAANGADISKYVTETRDRFISGDIPFSEWDNYISTIEEMGLEEFLEIQQTAYERYQDY